MEFYTVELIYRYPKPELFDKFAGDVKDKKAKATVPIAGKGFMKPT